MHNQILNFCLQRGLLVDNEVLNLLSETSDIDSIKIVIEKIKSNTTQKIITRNLLDKNKEQVNQVISSLPVEIQRNFENLKIKLGLSIEISKEVEKEIIKPATEINESVVKILSNPVFSDKKLEVKDFVNYFRNRFVEMRNVLQEHSELTNLTSLDKISGDRQGISVIGLVNSKSVTKNKNIIFEIEDLTGKAKILINVNKPELLEKAEEVPLDAVMGFRVSGNREILFANEIIFPEVVLPERKHSNVDENVLFIGDLHLGGKLFMEDKFLKFIDYLNDVSDEEVRKIKYIFVVGDLIAGVGNYPNQENELEIVDLEAQFVKAAELLGKIRKDIKIIISPGNHDGIRIMEPQPMFDEKFAWALYDVPNIILTTNPAEINIGSGNGFEGFNVLAYHGFSYFYYADNIFRLMKAKAAHNPELLFEYVLKNRHLAPTHASTQYFPGNKDIHFIKNIPDIILSGHIHKSSVSYYGNVLCISVSSWEAMTAYMEKVGSKPDFCKVPMFNLKTRAVKILDFE